GLHEDFRVLVESHRLIQFDDHSYARLGMERHGVDPAEEDAVHPDIASGTQSLRSLEVDGERDGVSKEIDVLDQESAEPQDHQGDEEEKPQPYSSIHAGVLVSGPSDSP